MKKTNYVKGLLASLLVVGGLAGCVEDRNNEPMFPDGASGGEVRLTLNVPGVTVAGTRAITPTEENTVKEIDVLAFKISGSSETFDYATTAKVLSGQGTASQSCTANLKVSTGQQRFVLIVNAHDKVNTLLSTDQKGVDKATLLANLRVDLGTADRWVTSSTTQYTPIPMWGESAAETVSSATTSLSTNIPLLRMLARVDVQVDGTVAGLRSKFKIRSVDLYNTNTGGLIVPAAGNVSTVNGTLKATQPSIPTDLQPASARKQGPIDYTDFTAPGQTDVLMSGAIYTFESANAAVTDPKQATVVVIGGIYGTDTSLTYYRVEFKDATTNARLNILRNYRYLFNIVDVKNRGFATAADAFNSTDVNMSVTVVAWEDSTQPVMVSNGSEYLAVSKGEINLFKNAYSAAQGDGSNTFNVSTDHTGGWVIDRIVDANNVPVTWLSVGSPNSGPANAKTATYVTAQANTSSADRTAFVWVKAGSMTYGLTVKQSGTTAMPTSLKIVDANGVEITELAFTSGYNIKPAAKTFTVNWGPAERDLSVATKRGPNGDTDFPAGSGQPNNGDAITTKSGSQTYTISPPAITQAEYNNNNFLLKSTQVDVTMNDGNGNTITKTITLRQMIPTVMTYPADSYVVNGSQYSYNVRSNVRWQIKSIVENQNKTYIDRSNTSIFNNSDANTQRIGYTAGPNSSTNGDAVSFTTAAQLGKWGTVNVTYTSPDTPAKFQDFTVTLVLAAPRFKMYSIGVGSNGEGGAMYNIGQYDQTPGKMLTDTRNFGLMPTSTVIGEPFVTDATVGSTAWAVSKNLTNGSNYTLTTSDIQGAIDWGADVLTICGAIQWGDDVSVMIKRQFLDNQKPVWVSIQEVNTLTSMINTIFGQPWVKSVPILYFTNYESAQGATYKVFTGIGNTDASDPVLAGPFGDTRGQYWGEHWTGSHGLFDLPTNVSTRYSNFINQSGTTTSSGADNNRQYNAFRLKQVPLVWFADDGFTRGDSSTSNNTSPFYIDSNNRPVPRTYGGASPTQQIYNSTIVANFIAWCYARNPAK